MEIDGSTADGAPARTSHAHFPQPGQQRPHQKNGGPHLTHQYVGNVTGPQCGCIHLDPVSGPGKASTQRSQNAAHHFDVLQPGNIVYFMNASAQKRGRQNGQGRVFGAMDADRSVQRFLAFDDKLFQCSTPVCYPPSAPSSSAQDRRASVDPPCWGWTQQPVRCNWKHFSNMVSSAADDLFGQVSEFAGIPRVLPSPAFQE